MHRSVYFIYQRTVKIRTSCHKTMGVKHYGTDVQRRSSLNRVRMKHTNQVQTRDVQISVLHKIGV